MVDRCKLNSDRFDLFQLHKIENQYDSGHFDWTEDWKHVTLAKSTWLIWKRHPKKYLTLICLGSEVKPTQCISIFALPKIMHVMPHAFSHQSSDHTLLITGAKMQPFTSSGYMPLALPVSSTQIPPPNKIGDVYGATYPSGYYRSDFSTNRNRWIRHRYRNCWGAKWIQLSQSLEIAERCRMI